VPGDAAAVSLHVLDVGEDIPLDVGEHFIRLQVTEVAPAEGWTRGLAESLALGFAGGLARFSTLQSLGFLQLRAAPARSCGMNRSPSKREVEVGLRANSASLLAFEVEFVDLLHEEQVGDLLEWRREHLATPPDQKRSQRARMRERILVLRSMSGGER